MVGVQAKQAGDALGRRRVREPSRLKVGGVYTCTAFELLFRNLKSSVAHYICYGTYKYILYPCTVVPHAAHVTNVYSSGDLRLLSRPDCTAANPACTRWSGSSHDARPTCSTTCDRLKGALFFNNNSGYPVALPRTTRSTPARWGWGC